MIRFCLFVLLALSLPEAIAAAVRLKVATLAQTGTSYHKSLLRLREQWREVSGGQVDLIIYPDGRLGGEGKTVDLLNIGAIDAAVLTAVGLTKIERGVNGLQSFPMGFRTLEQVDYVGERLRPVLEPYFDRKGFFVLFWSDAGWVKFFTTRPVRLPEDLRRLKLFVWAGDPRTIELYRANGFQVVPLETSEIVTALQTGMIEAVPCPPIFALTTQLYRKARYMPDINWAPLVGAMIVRKQAWEMISEELRPKLRQIAERIGQEIKLEGRREAEEAIQAMVQRGLQVIKLGPEIVERWREEAWKAYPQIRGALVPEDVFDEAVRLIKEYEANLAKGIRD